MVAYIRECLHFGDKVILVTRKGLMRVTNSAFWLVVCRGKEVTLMMVLSETTETKRKQKQMEVVEDITVQQNHIVCGKARVKSSRASYNGGCHTDPVKYVLELWTHCVWFYLSSLNIPDACVLKPLMLFVSTYLLLWAVLSQGMLLCSLEYRRNVGWAWVIPLKRDPHQHFSRVGKTSAHSFHCWGFWAWVYRDSLLCIPCYPTTYSVGKDNYSFLSLLPLSHSWWEHSQES